MDVITMMVTDKPVVIFSRRSCEDMSHSIKSLISSYGANPSVYVLDQLPNRQQIEHALQQRCCPGLPVVFIGQQLIGGPNEVMSLQVKNQLGTLLKKAGAIWI